MSRHHAHAGDHLVIVLAGVVAITFGAVCWSGLIRILGGTS